MVAIWEVEDFFWIALRDGLFEIVNYDLMVTAESDLKFSRIKSPKLARDYCFNFLKKILKTTCTTKKVDWHNLPLQKIIIFWNS